MKKYLLMIGLLTLIGIVSMQGCASPSQGAFLTVENTACLGCGECSKVCKYDAIVIIGNKAVIDPAKCQKCGQCVKVCPYDAIH